MLTMTRPPLINTSVESKTHLHPHYTHRPEHHQHQPTHSALSSSSSLMDATGESRLSEYSFDENDRLGSGHYGTVYKATRRSDGLTVALKQIAIFNMDTALRQVCLREAEILHKIQHEHIIQLYDRFIVSDHLYLVFEFADMGDMTNLINEMKIKQMRLPEIQIWQLIYCITSGLNYLHSRCIMHRDIKPANIYISRSGDVKVGDLGLGRELSSSNDCAGSLVGTPYYMSPEIINEEPYSFKTDIWSLGCLVYEIITLRVPFEGANLYILGQKIRDCQFAPVDGPYTYQLKDFVRALLQKQPEHRLSAGEISRLALSMIQGVSMSSLASNTLPPTTHPAPSTLAATAPMATITASITPTSAVASNEERVDPFKELDDLGIIGRGQYSVVHKAQRRTDGALLAVKCVLSLADVVMDDDKKDCSNTATTKAGDDHARVRPSTHSLSIMNEARLLGTLRHPHIIQYYSCHFIDGDLYLLLELAEGGDLGAVISAALQSGQYLPEATIWKYFIQVSSALAFMHQRRIMHRDIKPSNVFLTGGVNNDGDAVVKIGDLGLSRTMSSATLETFSEVGTPFYMSPEAVSQIGYSFASDVWALGCLLYELTMLRTPFYDGDSNLNLYTLGNRIRECTYEPIAGHYSQALRQLIACILIPQPQSRPTATQVYEVAQLAKKAFENGVVPNAPISQLHGYIQQQIQRKQLKHMQAQQQQQTSNGNHHHQQPQLTAAPQPASQQQQPAQPQSAPHRSRSRARSPLAPTPPQPQPRAPASTRSHAHPQPEPNTAPSRSATTAASAAPIRRASPRTSPTLSTQKLRRSPRTSPSRPTGASPAAMMEDKRARVPVPRSAGTGAANGRYH